MITYRTGGSLGAISDETGWGIEQGDIEAVASIVKSIAKKNESEVFAQRKACRERAGQEFDKDKCFEKYVALYEELINK